MGWNVSNILVNEAIANKKGGGSDPVLASRVTALETTVGDDTSGLVKDVDDLQSAMTGVYPLIISATPTKIGKWGNDDLYAVYVDGGTVSGTTKDIPYSFPSGATIRGLNGALNYSGSYFPLSFFNTDINYSIGLYYDGNNSVIKFASKASQGGTLDLIVLYSVAANNRKGGKK